MAALVTALAGCGGAGSGAGGYAHRYLGTQSPGDVWQWSVRDTTFTATNDTKGFTYAGTVTVLPTGFLKLFITDSNDPDILTGASAYAVEMPGTALIVKPAGADTSPPIVAASLGTNPGGPQVSFNFVAVPSPSYQGTDQAYGHVTLDVSGHNYTGASKRFQMDGTALTDGPCDFVGEGGMMTDLGGGTDGMTVTGAMTPSGVVVLDYGANKGGIIGVRQPPQPTDLAVLGTKSFRGFLINQGKTQCVSVSPNGDGTLHGVGYQNPSGVESGTSDGGSGVTVTFVSQLNPGLVRFTIDTSGGSESLVACVNVVSGKTMLFGFGAGSGTPYNVLLVEQ